MRDYTNSITTGMMILGALLIFAAATSVNAEGGAPVAENGVELLDRTD